MLAKIQNSVDNHLYIETYSETYFITHKELAIFMTQMLLLSERSLEPDPSRDTLMGTCSSTDDVTLILNEHNIKVSWNPSNVRIDNLTRFAAIMRQEDVISYCRKLDRMMNFHDPDGWHEHKSKASL